MNQKLCRVGTTYLPVIDVESSTDWYVTNLGATLSYMDSDKSIINLADQSFFLVKAKEYETANFMDAKMAVRFSLTFEVDGLSALEELHNELKGKGVEVGEIEDRGHAGRNFVFKDPNGNMFDVWSELSSLYKLRAGLE
ncbi:VOC family protein [Fredinandcohnia sp. 179-A 10B2 NHS]|uniref:VOC family protein n=1 Tax=Fredinandcohnia sp. 179-A 10B2 NHS TaxID=3235176 RepID=UPI00399EEB58